LPSREAFEQAGQRLTKELVDNGKLLEAGFMIFASRLIPADAPKEQRAQLLIAFMAGAEHVYSSIMGIMDEGDEPTEQELQRVEKIHSELQIWRGKLSELLNPSKGSA
jgi:hypothetical protein